MVILAITIKFALLLVVIVIVKRMSRPLRLHEVEMDDVVNAQLLQGDHLPPGFRGLELAVLG